LHFRQKGHQEFWLARDKNLGIKKVIRKFGSKNFWIR